MLSFTSSGGGFLGRGPVLPRASLKSPAGGGGDKDGAVAGGKRGGGVGRAKCGYRFYVLKQGYLRNSRRIMEISPGSARPPCLLPSCLQPCFLSFPAAPPPPLAIQCLNTTLRAFPRPSVAKVCCRVTKLLPHEISLRVQISQ